MGIDIILKIAGIGLLTAVVNVILKKSDKDEIGTFVTIAGVVVVLFLVMDLLGGLFDTIKQIFGYTEMEIFRVIGIGIIGAVVAGLLKTVKPEFSVFAVVGTGVIILVLLINSFNGVIAAFTEIVEKSGIPDELFSGILKIIGIGYLTEYSAGLCEDYGTPSIAKKLQLAGKVVIFLMSLPILTALIDVVAKFVE